MVFITPPDFPESVGPETSSVDFWFLGSSFVLSVFFSSSSVGTKSGSVGVKFSYSRVLGGAMELCDDVVNIRMPGVHITLLKSTVSQFVNPLPTNDAHMRHSLSISHKNLYGELILGVIL